MAAHPPLDMQAHHQLLKLLDDYAEEERSRERAIDELKKKRTELAYDVESGFADFERMKENRIAAREQLRELRVELEAIKAATNFKQTKVSTQQEEISKTSTLLKNLEDEAKCSRDAFISTIMEINVKVRKMQSSQHRGPPFQPYYQSFRCASRNPENSQPRSEPDIKKASTGIKEAGARHEEQSELLEKIRSTEAMLARLKANNDDQQQKLKEHKQTRATYIDIIGQVTQELTSTRHQSEKVEEQIASLTGALQDLHMCPQCGTDLLGQDVLAVQD